ncbi:MAG: hypothetical protein JF565_09800 [Propionibacteriales bacterium]|nr:hypothetical protein [Propionibacteriales bacterium]
MLGMRPTFTVVLLLALLTTSGCGADPSLRSLERDPMAAFSVRGTHLERESKDKRGTTLGMPVHASITRRFSLGSVAPDDAVTTAAAYAKAHGWTPENSRPSSFSAHKRIDGIRAELLVTSGPVGGTGALYVYLTAF